MDKQLILRRLDQLRFEMICEENKMRDQCNESSDNDQLYQLYYGFYGKMSSVKWAKEVLDEVRSAIDHMDEPSEVTEICPSCGKEVTLIWDTGKDGYKAYCPYCGKRLMLCSACHDDGFACDYDDETGGCRWNPVKGGAYEMLKKMVAYWYEHHDEEGNEK